VLRRCICAPLENADEIEGRSVSWLHSFAGRFVADTAARSAVGLESANSGFATGVLESRGGSAFVRLGRCASAELDSPNGELLPPSKKPNLPRGRRRCER
jgi:hypothetical protein